MNEKLVQALTKMVQVPNQSEVANPTDTRLSRYARIVVSLDYITTCLRETEVDLDASIQRNFKLEQDLKQKTQELAAKDKELKELQKALKEAQERLTEKTLETNTETVVAGEGIKTT